MDSHDNIESFLAAWPHEHVNYCYTNNAALNLAENLMFSAHEVGLPLVLFALDRKAFENCQAPGAVVLYDKASQRLPVLKAIKDDQFYNFDAPDYNGVTWACWELLGRVLDSGRSATYLDTDIVVCRNFESEISQLIRESDSYDCLIQFNGKDACAGFFAFHSRCAGKIKELFSEESLVRDNYLDYSHDQHFLNECLVANQRLTVRYLERDHYPIGKHFYDHMERIQSDCRLVHFNCLIGEDAKVGKMKELGYWHKPEASAVSKLFAFFKSLGAK